MFDDSDDDYNFDIDEVVRLANDEVKNVTEVTTGVAEDLRNDNLNMEKTDLHFNFVQYVEQYEENIKSKLELEIVKTRDRDLINNNLENKSRGIWQKNNKPNIEIGLTELPGPAGIFFNDQLDKQKETEKKNIRGMLTNRDGLHCWDDALKLLRLNLAWENKRMNLEMINNNIDPELIYLTAPLLVVGISKIEFTTRMSHDLNCILQDPTGELKGRILRDVFTSYENLIHVGSILLLRCSSVLYLTPNYIVTITNKSLIGIYSSQTKEIYRLQTFSKDDLIKWISEPISSFDQVRETTTNEEIIGSTVKSFTPAGGATGTCIAKFQTPIEILRNKRCSQTALNSSLVAIPNNRRSSAVTSCMNISQQLDMHLNDNLMTELLEGIDTDSLFDEF